MPYVVERICQQGAQVNAKRWFVPTGFQSKQLIVENGMCSSEGCTLSFALSDLPTTQGSSWVTSTQTQRLT